MRGFGTSLIRRKLMLKFMEHPKLVFKTIMHSLKWQNGSIYENHQNNHLFILPADAIQMIRREILNIIGPVASKNLLYYLNQLSADFIMKDAEDMGFMKKEKLQYFFAIMTLFGWGDIIDWNYDEVTKMGIIKIVNFPKPSEPFSYPVHFDFAGICARAIELVYNDKVLVQEVLCTEVSGIECHYKIAPIDPLIPVPAFKIFFEPTEKIDASLIPDYDPFEKFLDALSMPEKGILMVNERNRYVIKDVLSINSMIHANAEILGGKTIGAIIYRCARGMKFYFSVPCQNLSDVRSVLNNLSLMGWGLFELIETSEGSDNAKRSFKVLVKNSVFSASVPKGGATMCYGIAGVLHSIFEEFLKVQIRVKEEKCVVKGDPICEFQIKRI